MEVKIIASTPTHVRELAANLRPRDLQEVAMYGFPTNKALWRSYKSSIMRMTALIGGRVAAMWGVCGIPMDEVGQPWLMTTGVSEEISPLRFARIYQNEVIKMLGLFPHLENYCDAGYDKALRLLDIVGFDIHPPEPRGSLNGLFCKFEMVR